MVPVDRVGLYVPGGLAPLASSVIMNVVPAQVAGVGSIALASPPQREFGGSAAPERARHCATCSAWRRCTPSAERRRSPCSRTACPSSVRRWTWSAGPGNIYVVAAKRLLKGRVNIDSEAGPTEIAVLADRDRRPGPRRRRPDLPGRARPAGRRGPGHRLDRSWPTRSRPNWPTRCPAAKHAERISQALTGRQSAVVLVDDLAQGIDVVNAYAAEHLEIQAVGRRRASPAGSPTPARSSSDRGRRCRWATTAPAAPTCCPTAGCACHSSGLNVRRASSRRST